MPPHPRGESWPRVAASSSKITGSAALADELSLLAMPQAAWRGVSQPRAHRRAGFPLASGRGPDQILREPARLYAWLLPRLRLAGHQSRRAELESARRLSRSPRRNTALRSRCSTIRRPRRNCTASPAARRRGSRSPTTCRNMPNIRRPTDGHNPLPKLALGAKFSRPPARPIGPSASIGDSLMETVPCS